MLNFINSWWLSKSEQAQLCTTHQWEYWKVNKYSLHTKDHLCFKIQVIKEEVIGYNPISKNFYQKDFLETAFSKCFMIFFFNFFSCFMRMLEELSIWMSKKEGYSILQEWKHIIWYSIGIQLGCVQAVFFEKVSGALIVSCLHKKLNHEIPVEVLSSIPYKHIELMYSGLIKTYQVSYLAPCMQPIGNKEDLLEKGDHILDEKQLKNINEYELLKKDLRFEMIEKIAFHSKPCD